MTTNEAVQTALDRLTDAQLKAKAYLADQLIALLARDDEPKARRAMVRIREQRTQIQGEIERRAIEGGPVAQVVGMSAIKLRSSIGRRPGTRAGAVKVDDLKL